MKTTMRNDEDIIKAYYLKTKFWKDWWSETRGGKVKDDDLSKEIFRRETDVARSLGQK